MGEGEDRTPAGVSGGQHGRDRQEAYEPPALTELGSLAELTQGEDGSVTDGTFPGSILK